MALAEINAFLGGETFSTFIRIFSIFALVGLLGYAVHMIRRVERPNRPVMVALFGLVVAVALSLVAGWVLEDTARMQAQQGREMVGLLTEIRNGLSGRAETPPHDPLGLDRNCDDFTYWAEANAFFLLAGGPDADPHELDPDWDGIPCEDEGLLDEPN